MNSWANTSKGKVTTTAHRTIRVIDQVAASGILAVGLLHATATLAIYKRFSMSAVWFFSAAIVLGLTGVLNLLRIRYAVVAPGVRITSIAANVVLSLVLLTVAALEKSAQTTAGVAFCLLLLGITMLSFRGGE